MAGPVATLWARFRLDMSDFASKLNTASHSMRTFAKLQQSTLRSQSQGFNSANALIKTFNRTLSDTTNITRGILISQTFYAGVGAIREATGALWEFNKQLDYAKVTYSALFGDASLANDFMAVLQEHAIETIFDYQDLTNISKKLLAYGLEYENLMFIMEGLTNLGTMSGDSAALDRIALALGQIYTKGKLSAEEMRQLANAYVPITEIIQEKFGLSEEDLARVGDLNLPAEEVINAIVDYANENFSSVGDAAMLTITGLQAKIVDTLKTVGATMLAPITTAYKSFLVYIGNGLANIREEFAKGGVGGVFEYLVPNEATQKTLRTFFANVKNLFSSIASLAAAGAKWFSNFAQAGIAAFNAVAPAATVLINALAAVLNAMVSTEGGAAALRVALIAAAGAFVMLRVQAIGALAVTAVTKAITGLSKALAVLAAVISKHPIIALLSMLGVAIVGVSTASSSANNALSGFFDTIAGAGGSSGKDVLQATKQEIANTEDALDKFNQRLEEGNKDAEDFADGIGGAGAAAKKARGLLSFDEVFKLNEPSSTSSGSGAASGVLDDIEGIMDGLGSLGSALMPEIPDFSEYLDGFSDNLLGGMSDGLKEKIAAGGWGALIGGVLGALIGSAFGNPILGAKIGMAAGTLAGVLFKELGYAISNTATGAVAGIAKAISTAFGASLTRVIKTFASGGTISGFFKGLAGIFSATGAKALLKGGLIGAAVGLVVDGIAHLLWGSLEERFAGANSETAKVGQTIGSAIGAVIGGVFGGPLGAVIGSTIGTFAGGLVGLFWDPIKEYFDPDNNALSAFFVKAAGTIGAWAKDSVSRLSAWWDYTSNGFTNWWDKTSSGLSSWWSDTKDGFSDWWSNTTSGLSKWWKDTIATFSDWGSINGDTLRNWWSDTKTGFTNWFKDTFSGLTSWWADTKNGFTSWFSNTFSGIATWVTTTYNSFSQWRVDTVKVFTSWIGNVKNAITGWASDTWASFTQWGTNTLNSITSWVSNTVAAFNKFKEDAKAVIVGFGVAALASVKSSLSNVYNNIAAWLGNTLGKISDWFVTLRGNIATWWKGLFDVRNWKSGWESVKQWFSDLFSDIGNWFSNIGKSVTKWWDNLWSGKDVTVNTTTVNGRSHATLAGHASGGVFNREHIARFAEGNKSEAVIPLEENRAMQPFVDAVSNGLVNSLAPIIASNSGNRSNDLPPMYVGTLIADERGLRELYNKFEIIKVQEDTRRGLQSAT